MPEDVTSRCKKYAPNPSGSVSSPGAPSRHHFGGAKPGLRNLKQRQPRSGHRLTRHDNVERGDLHSRFALIEDTIDHVSTSMAVIEKQKLGELVADNDPILFSGRA